MAVSISPDSAKEKIKEKYGTQRAYADHLGITEESLSKRLSRMSYKFIKQLENDNIVVRESNVDYKLITEVEALSKELAKLKEEVTALKEMHADQALLIHSLKKENESLTEENRVLRVQSESITAAHVKIDVQKNNPLKKK